MPTRGVQQNIQESANHEDAPQDALHRKQRRRQSGSPFVTHAQQLLEGRAQQEDSISLPQMQEDVRGPVRAPSSLRPQAFRGRETLWLPQVW